jgi:hypothetical protein
MNADVRDETQDMGGVVCVFFLDVSPCYESNSIQSTTAPPLDPILSYMVPV